MSTTKTLDAPPAIKSTARPVLHRDVLHTQEVVGPLAEVEALAQRGLLEHTALGDVPDGVHGDAAREQEPVAHQPADVGRDAGVGLLRHED